MQNEDSDKGGGVAALDRAFAILGAFESGEKGVSLADLARRTGYYKSTLLRLLGALDHGGFVRKLEDGRYSIGPEPLRLAQIYQESFHVRHVVEPLLQQLAIDSGETSSFYVRQGSHRIVLHRVEPARAVRVSIREGERFPIDRGASGKVLLAFSKPYKKGFDDVRDRMWAVSYGERDPDTASVSVPVLGLGGELVGALTVSGPRERIGAVESMRAACKLLLSASARAGAALGGDSSMFAHGLKLADQNDFAAP